MTSRNRSISNWLLFMMALVAVMIVVGGATRLTNSGLSITEWELVKGSIPPLSDAGWVEKFELYKLIPEYEAEHAGMTMSEFKTIFYWEWGHRQLGRFIGLAYMIPLVLFTLRKSFPRGWVWAFWAVAVTIGLQGTVGWWMVHSGLQEGMVNVSQYRLATHLSIAFVILGSLYWLWKKTRLDFKAPNDRKAVVLTSSLGALVFIQIIAGAFVAGTKSGHTYNEWPLMDGDFIPQGYGVQTPFWRNLFENPAAIQFNHRTLAYVILALSLFAVFKLRNHGQLSRSAWVLLAILLWQVVLGIWTLLAVAPLNLALLHQFSSIFVFLAAMSLAWNSRYIAVK